MARDKAREAATESLWFRSGVIGEPAATFHHGHDGSTICVTRIRTGHAALVIPVHYDGDDLYVGLTETFRYAIARKSWEYPRLGCVDDRDGEPAAKGLLDDRDLEAVGFHLGDIHPDTEHLDTTVHVWKAQIRFDQFDRRRNPAGFTWATLDEFTQMIAHGEIVCAATLAAHLMLITDHGAL